MSKRRLRHRDNGFDEWGGYMEAKKTKLENQFKDEALKSGLQVDNLFKDIAIFVNGYTVPSADELRYLMMKHGGTYHHYYRSQKTTHVISSNLPDSKLKQLKGGLLIVRPEWIVDSIKEGRLLNYSDYLLVTNQSKTQPVLIFKKPSPAKTARDSCFLSEFYSNSRLHLISTMGAMFKQYVNELRSKDNHIFSGLDKLKNLKKEPSNQDEWGNIVMHIDMDCFFVSVSLRKRPDLVGTPVAITHAKGSRSVPRDGVDRQAEYNAYFGKSSSDPNHWSNSETSSMSEIASCSYEARKAGVKNGMFLGQAFALCPNLTPLNYDFEAYKEVSLILYDTVASYSLNIEAVSCDEMYVDCSEILNSFTISPLEFAEVLRKDIKEKTGCPCSCGFGSNKLQARLATKKAKPNGQFYLSPDAVEQFMAEIPVSELPGVGCSSTLKLAAMGVTLCSELQRIPLIQLQSEFGTKAGEVLLLNSFGKDLKGLEFTKIRKSVSAEVNYGIRFTCDQERDAFLIQLTEEVSSRLREVKMIGKSITLKIMVKSQSAPEETAKFLGHGICDHFTKSNALKTGTDNAKIIYREVSSLIKMCNASSKDLRGIGIQIGKLEQKCNNSIINCLQKASKFTHRRINTLQYQKQNHKANCILQNKIDNTEVTSELVSNMSLSQVDPTFLNALPDDIKNEILAATKKIPVCAKAVSIKNGLPLQENINDNSQRSAHAATHLTASNNIPGESLFSSVPPEQMIYLINNWLDTGDAPQLLDVEMFSSYLTSLVKTHQLNHLYVIINTFQRLIVRKKKLLAWKSSFTEIIKQVQTTMIKYYGATLLITEIVF